MGPRILEPIGIWENQLWFAMNSNDLLCLNAATGAFMHYLRDIDPTDDNFDDFNWFEKVLTGSDTAKLLEKEGKIVNLLYRHYWEIDLRTMEISITSLESHFNEVGCFPGGISTDSKKTKVVDGDLIYVISSHSRHKNRLMSFNRKTMVYDSIIEIPGPNGYLRSIEKHGDRLYVHTNAKELLIYEL